MSCDLCTVSCDQSCDPCTDILLSLPEEWGEVQNEVCTVCEMCWLRGEEVEGREQMVPHCLLYLVARTLSQGAIVSLIITIIISPP